MRTTTAVEHPVLIEFAGHEYRVSLEMAEIFLNHAMRVVDAEEEELVPLRHSEGVELLLITPTTPLRVGTWER